MIPFQRETELKPLKLGPVKPIVEHSDHPVTLLSRKQSNDWSFEYTKPETLVDEINDFFNHHDFQMLENARLLSGDLEKDQINNLLSDLLKSSPSTRLVSATKLLYFSTG
jgi:hypothetical protein